MEPGPDAPVAGGGGTTSSAPRRPGRRRPRPPQQQPRRRRAGSRQSSNRSADAATSRSTAASEATAGSWPSAGGSAAAQQPPPPAGLSRYESQKRRDWNTFLQYLRNHKPPLTLARCSLEHVIEFLRYLDQFGKTKVHADGCAYFGQPNPPAPCACPLRQAWGSLDALIGRLRAAYEESGGRPESNPFVAKAVRIYLRDVREAQAKARGIPYEKKKRKRGTAAGPPVAPPPVVTAGTTSGAAGGEEEEDNEDEPSTSAARPWSDDAWWPRARDSAAALRSAEAASAGDADSTATGERRRGRGNDRFLPNAKTMVSSCLDSIEDVVSLGRNGFLNFPLPLH